MGGRVIRIRLQLAFRPRDQALPLHHSTKPRASDPDATLGLVTAISGPCTCLVCDRWQLRGHRARWLYRGQLVHSWVPFLDSHANPEFIGFWLCTECVQKALCCIARVQW